MVALSASLVLAVANAQSVKWTFEAAGIAKGAPALSADGSTLFVGSDILYAVDSSSGVQKWACNSAQSPYSPILSADGSTVFAASTETGLSAVDATTGVQKWASLTKAYGKPALSADGNTLFIANYGKELFAVDSKSGATKWSFDVDSTILSSPVISADDSTVFFGAGRGEVYGVDTSSGTQKWVYEIGNYTYASPALSPDGSTLYIGSGYGKFQAFDPSTGALKWNFETSTKKERDSSGGFEIKGKPAFTPDGSTVFVGTFNDHLFALDALTGEQKWKHGYYGATDEIHGSVAGGAGVSNDGSTVFVGVGSSDQSIYAIDVLSGVKKWNLKTGDRCESDPVFSADGSTVFIGCKNLYALDLQASVSV